MREIIHLIAVKGKQVTGFGDFPDFRFLFSVKQKLCSKIIKSEFFRKNHGREVYMSEKAEVTIESLRVSLTSQHRIILLKEKDGVLSLPLFIGQFEAESIVLALQDIEISRPQPHDLMRSIIKALDSQILYAEITEMKAATFYAVLVLRNAAGGEVRRRMNTKKRILKIRNRR